MTYYLAISLRDKDYIIIDTDMKYTWVKSLKRAITSYEPPSGRYASVEDWVTKLPGNGMQFLCTFTNYSTLSTTHPELFI